MENKENKIKIPSDQLWSLLDSNAWTASSQAPKALSQLGALCYRGDENLLSLLEKKLNYTDRMGHGSQIPQEHP